jgi:hypothetical protein
MQTSTGDFPSRSSTRLAASVLPIYWNKLLCVLAVLYALAVVYYIFAETQKPRGGLDFHPFWYAGHFILQGQDPYEAYFTDRQLALPVRYLDGVIINEYPVAQEQLSPTPANTPVMLLLLSLFSHFSWNVAKWMFVVVNLTAMLLAAWIALRQLPFAGIQLDRFDELLLLLIFFDFSATRIAIENGQTTLLVFLMMLLAIVLARRSWPLAGLALGIALSKYSLALAVFVFLLYKKNFRILLLAIAVQILGILVLAAIGGNSPVTVVQENIQIFSEIFSEPGIHLADFTRNFTKNPVSMQIPVIIMTGLVFGLLFLWLRKYRAATSSQQDILDFHIMTIFFIWTLLVGYHRQYDTLVLILFVILIFKGLAYPDLWRLSNTARSLVLALMALLLPVLVLPARLADRVLSGYYGTISDATVTVLIVTMLFTSLFLTQRFLQRSKPATVHQRRESHDL